ncbi:MAG: glycosyltransferase family 1 protein [Patescibacteria group bacterium]|jgi:glycosyltransferase involved in cell wall biosynthesis|nr:glycosyltransferase family 1 protein [Patescibacteria group bacterium]
MKIGVDIRVLMDEKYSGVSEYTANLLQAILNQAPSDYQFILFYNCRLNIKKRMDKWKRDNVEIISTRYSNKLFNYFLQKIFSYPKVDKLIGGVDVFWSPHFNFTSFSDVKRIITIHDLSFLRYPKYFSFRQNLWHKLLNVKKIIRQSDRIVAVSENTKNDIEELMEVDEDKTDVIYSGNNLEKKEINEKEIKIFRDKYFNSKSFSYILYLGTIEPRKNISNLIKAYNIYRDDNESGLKLVLAGRKGWKTKAIFKEYNNSKYRDDIIFLDYIETKDKDVLYKEAEVFVYPSFYEGFGFPPLEAMTYGVPTIVSNVSSLPEVVNDGALMVNPYDPKEIATALEELLNDKELYNHFSKKGRERTQFFNWQKTADKYLQIFKSLKDEK